jgi:sigma-B regulation protein RsbU (phosphoserine phosphatase)
VTAEAQVASLLRGEIANIVGGAFFLFICFVALSIATIRPKKSARLLLWLGIWSGMYSAQVLLQSEPVVKTLPILVQGARQFLLVSFNYLIIVAAVFAFLELTLGTLRRFLQIHLVVDITVAVAAITLFAVFGSAASLLVYNQILVAILLGILVLTLSIPGLSRRFLVVSQHRMLTIGTLIFAAQALWINVARPLHIRVPNIYNTLGFAIFLLSIGYTGVEIMVTDERRLFSLEDELAIARRLQFSILPERTPQIAGLDIAAVYKPMSAVAGDFYEFLVADKRHLGFLVADVSGHGVPAALIASMIKVAIQAGNGYANDPAQVLQSLGSILNKNVRGQIVSAAYLWMDMETRTATYSGAGHPPLVRWRKKDSTFARIESNGLLFGINPGSEYPVCNFPLLTGDRFLLYTDGMTEAENQAGQQFGESRLEQVMRDNQWRSASELSELLLAEIRAWQPANVAQQDDITLVLVDVLESVNLPPRLDDGRTQNDLYSKFSSAILHAS